MFLVHFHLHPGRYVDLFGAAAAAAAAATSCQPNHQHRRVVDQTVCLASDGPGDV